MSWKEIWNGPKPRKVVRVHHVNVEHSIEGLYAGRAGDQYIIEHAKLIVNPKAKPVGIGTVWIPVANVSFFQEVSDWSGTP